jgi:hypothetical protein
MLTEFDYKTYNFRSHFTNGMLFYYQGKYFIFSRSFSFFTRISARRLKDSKENKNNEQSSLRKIGLQLRKKIETKLKR